MGNSTFFRVFFTKNFKKDPTFGIYRKSKNYVKSKRLFSEDFDVVVDGNIITPEKERDVQDDQRFNTEKHHKQQHKF